MGSTDVAVAWMRGRTWMRVPESVKITVTGEWPAGVSAKDLILKIIGDLTVDGATYQALCFAGPAVQSLDVSGRMTLCNMAIDAGAKFAYVQPAAITAAYLRQHGRPEYEVFFDDEDARYARTLVYDVSGLAPQVARPHSVDNVCEVGAVEGLVVDELFLGACTNGRYEDLEVAAAILKGCRIASTVRLLVTPASQEVYLRAVGEGLIATFIESGAMINAPGCSACFGGSGGILGRGEKLLTTANRNFRSRVGSPESEIYLASPATVAASAITGCITDPRRTIQ
jgi:3-isopropylmalate/(R)-2-methylmalate dehydratase large subunit